MVIDPIIPPRNVGLPQESSISPCSWHQFNLCPDLFTHLASSSTVLHSVFLSLPLPRLPWGFLSRACLAMSSEGFRSVWPSHPHLRFLICRSILGCFVRFHSSLFVIWSGQKIFNVSLRFCGCSMDYLCTIW